MAKVIVFISILFGVARCVGDVSPGVHIEQPDTIKLETTPSGEVIDTIYIAEVIPEPEPEPELPIREQLMGWYRSKIGVKEYPNNRGEEIDKWNTMAGVPLASAWCATFAGAGYKEFGLPVPNGYAWSPSWFPSSKVIPNDKAQMGDVGGIYYSSLGRIGHVFVYDENPSQNSAFAVTVEGNTNEAGSNEGDMVMRKKRSKSKIAKTSKWIQDE